MTSALCTVNGSATLGGIDLFPGDFVTIQLVNLSGVNSWQIRCYSADDLHATTDVVLSINSITKTATFIMPVDTNGMTFLFESIVNNQFDNVNKVSVPSLRQTFAICARAVNGFRPIPRGEKLDYDPTNGWIKEVNTICRNTAIPSALPGLGLYASGGILNVGATDASIAISADSIGVGVLQSDAQHGVRGGGTQHAAATTSVNGFMLAADKLKLNNATDSPTASTLMMRDSNGTISNFRTISIQPSSDLGADHISFSWPGRVSDISTRNLFLNTESAYPTATVNTKAGDCYLNFGRPAGAGNGSALDADQGRLIMARNATVKMYAWCSPTAVRFQPQVNFDVTTVSTNSTSTHSGSIVEQSGDALGATSNSGSLTRQSGNTTTGKTGDLNDTIGTGATRGNINQIATPPVAPTVAFQAAVYQGPNVSSALTATSVGQIPSTFLGCVTVCLDADKVINLIQYKKNDVLLYNASSVNGGQVIKISK